ncbi:hypothetical protein L2E82_33321 [Cichorium intybus]|uniref:Uncharacterized protein n=1 Tax=Cichorium intybus TaxID=13427 RepID=A0ACB9BK76_CICIN|nr:hypothetical protein L2E82_33321 [Cichorium intybus]
MVEDNTNSNKLLREDERPMLGEPTKVTQHSGNLPKGNNLDLGKPETLDQVMLRAREIVATWVERGKERQEEQSHKRKIEGLTKKGRRCDDKKQKLEKGVGVIPQIVGY